MDVIVGTAGHIDHGKTALIKALTGTDTDRLPEEKKRGITIDLGFAELRLGEHEIGFVDVPGHERFVKNMLAGASGIDLVLLIIAADEGVMPQTREHFDICRLLGVANGLVVVTKADLVDEEMLDLVRLEAAELTQKSFLADAPVIAVSSKTGAGIEELKQALLEAAGNISERPAAMVTRLPIDRSFTVKGFGAVVTGTLASGSIGRADELELMPDGKKVRVRGLQTHGQDADSIGAGHRVAVNLAGVDHAEIERGMTLCEAGTLRPTQMIDTRVEVLQNAPRPLRSRQRVRLHIGTAEILARVHVINAEGEIKPGDAGLVQLRPETEIVAVPGERFILRSYSPQATIAGGRSSIIFRENIGNAERGKRPRVFEQKLVAARSDRAETVELIIDAAGGQGMTIPDIQARTGWKRNVIETAIAESGERLFAAGEVYIAQSNFEALKQKMLDTVGEHHKREPLSEGITREALRESVFAHKPVDVFRAVIAAAEREGLVTAIARSGQGGVAFANIY